MTDSPLTADGMWRIGAEARDLDRGTLDAILKLSAAEPPGGDMSPASADMTPHLMPLFIAQVQTRHTDFAARWLQAQGEGFYTIGSGGHEANAAVGLLSETSDPALLHYRSGGLYIARAMKDGTTHPTRDILLGAAATIADPISGGRHKVFGHPALHVIPQTSTIASHLPRAVGLAFSLGLAKTQTHVAPWPEDAVVLCSFGDASANHSTAVGAMNAAAYLTQRGIDCPILFICEDNGIGISTPSPTDWPGHMLRSIPGMRYHSATGEQPAALLGTVAQALRHARETRKPTILHLSTVRYLGHAGSDVESAYRATADIQAERLRDPILHSARAVIEHGLATPEELADLYNDTRVGIAAEAAAIIGMPRLEHRAEVMRPISGGRSENRAVDSQAGLGASLIAAATSAPVAGGLTLAQAINAALAAVLEETPATLVFGEDVSRKGGVYGVTRGLRKRFTGSRVFDTVLDEQTVLGTALGAALAGFVPIPEIQYLAYLHNAEDQLRGEAASLSFFSNGQYRNGMVIRIAGLAYQRGFGGHFHNDNSLAVLRDIPGIVVAVPSSPDDAAGMLRTCVDLAQNEGRVCVFVEPIALYHTRDVEDGDHSWLRPVDVSARVPLGEVALHGSTRFDTADLLILTYGNGVRMSLRAQRQLEAQGVRAGVMDLRWLLPLPVEAIEFAVLNSSRVLIVDEGRASGGIGDALTAIVARCRPGMPLDCVSSADSFIPLGPAAATVLVQEIEIIQRALKLVE